MKDSSLDTTKENASMVGSSLTESKQDRENCDDPGSSSYKEIEESCPVRAEEQGHPFNGIGSLSASTIEKRYTTRYFIIKSLSHQNIQLSIEKGIWATQVMNEPILEEAFHNTSRVILIFSVNMSGFFQGYAQMMSSVGWRRENIWSESNGGSNPWGRTFKVKWLRLNNLPFQKTLHLKNPLNDYKPVKISRDCQELSQDVGEALCRLIDGDIDMDEKLKRNSDFTDEFLLKRPCREIAVPLQDEDYASVSSSNMSWAGAPLVCPSLLYQHSMLADVHDTPLMHGMSSGGSEHLPTHLKGQRVSLMKHSYACGNPINRHDKRDKILQFSDRDLSDQRSALADAISDEDILDMTYEEYLWAHGRSNLASTHLAQGGTPWPMQGPSMATEKKDDRYSKYLADWYRSQNKNVNSYYHPAYK